jgi:hypothetical protein
MMKFAFLFGRMLKLLSEMARFLIFLTLITMGQTALAAPSWSSIAQNGNDLAPINPISGETEKTNICPQLSRVKTQ